MKIQQFFFIFLPIYQRSTSSDDQKETIKKKSKKTIKKKNPKTNKQAVSFSVSQESANNKQIHQIKSFVQNTHLTCAMNFKMCFLTTKNV